MYLQMMLPQTRIRKYWMDQYTTLLKKGLKSDEAMEILVQDFISINKKDYALFTYMLGIIAIDYFISNVIYYLDESKLIIDDGINDGEMEEEETIEMNEADSIEMDCDFKLVDLIVKSLAQEDDIITFMLDDRYNVDDMHNNIDDVESVYDTLLMSFISRYGIPSNLENAQEIERKCRNKNMTEDEIGDALLLETVKEDTTGLKINEQCNDYEVIKDIMPQYIHVFKRYNKYYNLEKSLQSYNDDRFANHYLEDNLWQQYLNLVKQNISGEKLMIKLASYCWSQFSPADEEKVLPLIFERYYFWKKAESLTGEVLNNLDQEIVEFIEENGLNKSIKAYYNNVYKFPRIVEVYIDAQNKLFTDEQDRKNNCNKEKQFMKIIHETK